MFAVGGGKRPASRWHDSWEASWLGETRAQTLADDRVEVLERLGIVGAGRILRVCFGDFCL